MPPTISKSRHSPANNAFRFNAAVWMQQGVSLGKYAAVLKDTQDAVGNEHCFVWIPKYPDLARPWDCLGIRINNEKFI